MIIRYELYNYALIDLDRVTLATEWHAHCVYTHASPVPLPTLPLVRTVEEPVNILQRTESSCPLVNPSLQMDPQVPLCKMSTRPAVRESDE